MRCVLSLFTFICSLIVDYIRYRHIRAVIYVYPHMEGEKRKITLNGCFLGVFFFSVWLRSGRFPFWGYSASKLNTQSTAAFMKSVQVVWIFDVGSALIYRTGFPR